MADENPRDSPGDTPAPSAAADRPRRRGLVVVPILVALLVACGYLGYLVWQDREDEQLRSTAAAEASRLVEQQATYDLADVDPNLEAVTAEATPEFAESYREDSDGRRELLSNGAGASTRTLVRSAVERVAADSAVVPLCLDQEISNVTVPDGRVDASRMVVGLSRDGDRWLLDSAALA